MRVCRRGFGDGGSGAVFAEPAVQGLLFATVICFRTWLASLGFAGSREGWVDAAFANSICAGCTFVIGE